MRKFGVEIECLLPAGLSMVGLRELITAAGVAVETASYSDHNYRRGVWKIKPDGSLPHNGAEVVSPPSFDFRDLEKVCRVLATAGVTVNVRCGLHVHFDVSDLQAWQVADIALRWFVLGTDISSVLPRSRRSNHYCAAFNTLEVEALKRTVAGRKDRLPMDLGDRYRALNLTNYNRIKTIEFRQGGGTTNFEKISNWVRFIDAFIADTLAKRNAALRGVAAVAPVASVSTETLPRGGRTFNRFVALMAGGATVTIEDARTTLGLETPQLILRFLKTLQTQHGWNIVLQKNGRQVVSARRQLTTDTAPLAANEIRLLDAGNFTDGVPGDVCTWLVRRAAEFATDNS